jgi:hypothetical protein
MTRYRFLERWNYPKRTPKTMLPLLTNFGHRYDYDVRKY